ncbi:MAG: hypothetical protein KGL93_13910 [Gemmatimonadota bacterium]|nr:hypothetical protein [Gemmatimonadota bacterium]HEU4988321.1 hypothetical protein [Gemmatimonadaceae bacterium]
MAELNHRQYELLERAVVNGQRIVVYRRGTEYIVVPDRLVVRERREAIEARNPTTGDRLTLFVDELDAIEVVR